MDRLDTMQAFVAVADRQGFASAARALGVSAPTVTRLIASLEARLKLQLLHRTTRAVRLTDAGRHYLARVRPILEAVRDADANALAEQSKPGGRFVVTAPALFGRLEFAPLLSRFVAKYPEVTPELLLLDRITQLVEEGIDLALRIGTLDDSSLRSRLVGSTRRVVVASPGYLARHGRPRQLADLAKHRVVHLTPLDGRTPEWPFQRDGREHRVTLQPAFTTNSADAAIEHALRDGGLAMVLSYQVAKAVAAGKLEVLLSRFEPPPRPIQLVYPDGRIASATTRAFIDFVVASARWQFDVPAPG